MIDITETCAECKFCTKLYVPPCECFEDIPKDAYVCTIWLLTGQADEVQYLGDNKGFCEMFSKKVVSE